MKPNPTTLFVLGLILLTGCYIVAQPGPVTNFLSGGNAMLAQAIRRAAADWARHGLEIANYVTVDDGKAGIPVRFASAKELAESCPHDRPVDQAGCTHWAMGDWLGLLIRRDLESDPAFLSYMVQHEMIHALVPKAPHLEGAVGIFNANRTVDHITRADMAHLARYSDVIESEVPFFEDA